MRYIVNNNGYISGISFGCPLVINSSECTEYKGRVPDGYISLEEWYLEEELTLWRWKIVGGNLTLDPNATAPKEGQWGEPKLQDKSHVVYYKESQRATIYPDPGYDGFSKVNVFAPLKELQITPTHEEQIILPPTDYAGYGAVRVNGDPDLVPENIKKGVSVWDVTGTLELGYEMITETAENVAYAPDGGVFRNTLWINPSVISKYPNEMPARIDILQHKDSCEFGASIVYALIAGLGDGSTPVVVLTRDDEEYMYYYSTPAWLHVKVEEGSGVYIYSDEDWEKGFNGKYVVTLYYPKK